MKHFYSVYGGQTCNAAIKGPATLEEIEKMKVFSRLSFGPGDFCNGPISQKVAKDMIIAGTDNLTAPGSFSS